MTLRVVHTFDKPVSRFGARVIRVDAKHCAVLGGGQGRPRTRSYECHLVNFEIGSFERMPDCPIVVDSAFLFGARLVVVGPTDANDVACLRYAVAMLDLDQRCWSLQDIPMEAKSRVAFRPDSEMDLLLVGVPSPGVIELLSCGLDRRSWVRASYHVASTAMRSPPPTHIAGACSDPSSGVIWIVTTSGVTNPATFRINPDGAVGRIAGLDEESFFVNLLRVGALTVAMSTPLGVGPTGLALHAIDTTGDRWSEPIRPVGGASAYPVRVNAGALWLCSDRLNYDVHDIIRVRSDAQLGVWNPVIERVGEIRGLRGCGDAGDGRILGIVSGPNRGDPWRYVLFADS